MIIEVGWCVLEEACRQAAMWRRAGHPIGMAVNVSARQLDRDEFVTVVRNALSSSGLDASALTLEITETSLMRNMEATVQRLTAISNWAYGSPSTTSARGTPAWHTYNACRSTR